MPHQYLHRSLYFDRCFLLQKFADINIQSGSPRTHGLSVITKMAFIKASTVFPWLCDIHNYGHLISNTHSMASWKTLRPRDCNESFDNTVYARHAKIVCWQQRAVDGQIDGGVMSPALAAVVVITWSNKHCLQLHRGAHFIPRWGSLKQTAATSGYGLQDRPTLGQQYLAFPIVIFIWWEILNKQKKPPTHAQMIHFHYSQFQKKHSFT